MLNYYLKRLKESRLLHKGKRLFSKIDQVQNIEEMPFFLVSCGRSGTTLLRKMLMRGGDVHIPPESDDLLPQIIQYHIRNPKQSWPETVEHCLRTYQEADCFAYWNIDLWADIAQLLQLAPEKQRLHQIVSYIYRCHAQKFNPEATRMGDKTPYLVLRLDWIRLLYPEAPILHLMRDGRAVVASRMKAFGESMELATNRWIWSLKAIEKLKKEKQVPLLEIRYEDLVAQPENTLQKICGFLQLPYTEDMLGDKKVVMGDDVLAHHENTKSNKILNLEDKWKTSFTAEELKVLNKQIKPYLNKTGYL